MTTHAVETARVARREAVSAAGSAALIEVNGLSRNFGAKQALKDVSLQVAAGEVHALLGPNGAGKTTLLRILTGLLTPSAGSARMLGLDTHANTRILRKQIGLVPAGDRTFYLRISALENLVFFGRLYGLTRREALDRARAVLEQVGLGGVERQWVAEYSHGMQKRLSVARGLLTRPPVLLVDEATHDLDPIGARRIQELVTDIARTGTAVVWTTQRLDEIRAFADRVTVLREGVVRFVGSVPELMAHALRRRYLVRVTSASADAASILAAAEPALRGVGELAATGDGRTEHFLLSLSDTAVLGDAVTRLTNAGLGVYSCSEERSEIEEAFLNLTGDAT